MAERRTAWIGRVSRLDEDPPRVIRAWTEGAAPGPHTLVEEIEDPFVDPDPANRAMTADTVTGGWSGPWIEFASVAPVAPSKVLGIGRNYAAHAAEHGLEPPTTPLVFLKPSSCLCVSGQAIELPGGYQRIDMETELVVVIGATAKDVPVERALDHVAAYTLGNDVSCRDLQKSDGQWARAKGFDTFGPLAPFVRMVAPGSPVPELELRGYLDDVVQQQAPVTDMIFDVATLIAHISACMTLNSGDLVFTGTPAGVAALSPGQVVRIESHGFELASLVNPVVAKEVQS